MHDDWYEVSGTAFERRHMLSKYGNSFIKMIHNHFCRSSMAIIAQIQTSSKTILDDLANQREYLTYAAASVLSLESMEELYERLILKLCRWHPLELVAESFLYIYTCLPLSKSLNNYCFA